MRPAALSLISLLSVSALFGPPAFGETVTLEPRALTEWKPVYAEVETRDRVPARARIGGTISELMISEGDRVEAGQRVALVEDSKLFLAIDGINANLQSLGTQLEQAQADLARGTSLSERGVISNQRLETLQTAVSVLEGQISSLDAERHIVTRQIEEGAVLAPEAGVVLSVPVAKGAVVMPGEQVALIGAGGVFLRLAVPERYADALQQGDPIEIAQGDLKTMGRLAKIYPLIQGGRVQADVEVDGLPETFVGRRVQLRLPVGERQALLIPREALLHSGGLDFVAVNIGDETLQRVVVPGEEVTIDGAAYIEILSGLTAGDKVTTSHE
ncbi:efflux RND transporter periplasmic adaptor subunit [Tropicibacter oceani]|uniref:Efflux RND transporter periplasmic adaptor subunit n=1 Tax=Tropicibacter oceani TaxID=3058420 RepID=A0ABY8QL48_9RHOB|nr:efflux RND transporter periplasmic adaptor subunit [Tropicibacter oceani]WGW04741.1 efflux RND transporter periplasmic adaptor subunit [Tropicibacter oceani]